MLIPIEVPDVLPNNMRQIRQMRDIKTSEIAEALSFNNSYISVLENYNSNMSGVTALRIMDYLNVNFEQFFDMKKSMILPFTVKSFEDITIDLNIEKSLLEDLTGKNLIKIEEKIGKELQDLGRDSKIESFEILDSEDIVNNIFKCKVKTILVTEETIEKEFDIGFFSEIDADLFMELNKMTFTQLRQVSLSKDKKDNSKTLGRFESMNHIKYIENYLKLTPEDVKIALDITTSTYDNLIYGSQKLSTKLMWKMVKLFKVPFELIINVPLYLETFG